MFRQFVLASAIALGTMGATQAHDPGPWLIGGGEDAELVYARPSSNLVGGGFASIAGGGDNLQLTYGPRVITGASGGLVAELVGGGEDAQVVYRQVSPSGVLIAGRPRRPGG